MRHPFPAHYPWPIRLGAILLALCLVPLSGCRATSPVIHLICSGDTGFYWENLIEGAKLAADDNYVQLEIHVVHNQAESQARINELQHQNPGAFVLALDRSHIPSNAYCPVDSVTVNCDTGALVNVLSVIKNNDTYMAMNSNNTIRRRIGLQISMLMITNEAYYHPNDAWESQFRTEAGYGGSSFIRRINCSNNEQIAYNTCKRTLEQNPTINAIVCQSENATVGALRAVQELDSPAVILGRDINSTIVEGIREGRILCSYVVNAYAMGYLALVDAAVIAQGQLPETRRGLDALYVDADSLYDEALAKLLFPI